MPKKYTMSWQKLFILLADYITPAVKYQRFYLPKFPSATL